MAPSGNPPDLLTRIRRNASSPVPRYRLYHRLTTIATETGGDGMQVLEPACMSRKRPLQENSQNVPTVAWPRSKRCVPI
jgi:hypothetical protein